MQRNVVGIICNLNETYSIKRTENKCFELKELEQNVIEMFFFQDINDWIFFLTATIHFQSKVKSSFRFFQETDMEQASHLTDWQTVKINIRRNEKDKEENDNQFTIKYFMFKKHRFLIEIIDKDHCYNHYKFWPKDL